MRLLADVNFAEATWILVAKSIIIFLGVFLIKYKIELLVSTLHEQPPPVLPVCTFSAVHASLFG